MAPSFTEGESRRRLSASGLVNLSGKETEGTPGDPSSGLMAFLFLYPELTDERRGRGACGPGYSFV